MTLPSPGVGALPDGSFVVRVYADADPAIVETEYERNGLAATVVPSQYTTEQFGELETLLTSIELDDGEALGYQYDAVGDLVTITGNISPDVLENAIGARFAYRFEHVEDAGRTSG